MGFRAHIRTESLINYGMEAFNHLQQELGDFISEHCDECYIEDESGYKDEWEISRDEFEKMIQYIKENYDDDDILIHDHHYIGYNKQEVLDIFDTWLKQSSNPLNFTYPDYIYIDWF